MNPKWKPVFDPINSSVKTFVTEVEAAHPSSICCSEFEMTVIALIIEQVNYKLIDSEEQLEARQLH